MKIIMKGGLKSLFQKRFLFHRPIDAFMIIFLLGNCFSLVFADNISSLISLRFVFLGIIMYFSVQLNEILPKQKRLIINGLGILTIIVATISVLQLIAPDIINSIATHYFGSADAQGLSGEVVLGVTQDYNGLVTDFSRGRLLHWGSIVLCFPAFYFSLFLYEKKKTLLFYLYSILSFSIIIISFVSSNFRWTAICFLLMTFLSAKILNYFKFLNSKFILRYSLFLILIVLFGLIISSLVFGYNLIDRFLLSNVDRDVTDTIGRLYLFQIAVDVFKTSPVFGVGVGNYQLFVQKIENFRYFSIHDQLTYVLTPMAPHNDWLFILAEVGFTGFLSFLLIVYSTLKKYWLIFKENSFDKPTDKTSLFLYSLGVTSILGFLFYGMFENIYPHNFIYLFAFTGLAFSPNTRSLKLNKS